MSAESFEKKLIVTKCEEHAVWQTTKGGETVLFAVEATDEQGEKWEPAPLRSFAQLEIGVPQVYQCAPYVHKKTGERSMTLKRPRHNTTEKLRHLENTVADLAARVAALEAATPPRPGALPDMPGPPWGRIGGVTT